MISVGIKGEREKRKEKEKKKVVRIMSWLLFQHTLLQERVTTHPILVKPWKADIEAREGHMLTCVLHGSSIFFKFGLLLDFFYLIPNSFISL